MNRRGFFAAFVGLFAASKLKRRGPMYFPKAPRIFPESTNSAQWEALANAANRRTRDSYNRDLRRLKLIVEYVENRNGGIS